MKFFYSITLIIISNFVNAQCDGDRYMTQIFEDFELNSDIVYGSNIDLNGNEQTLHMDMYEPFGDTEDSRAVIVMAHGGFFIAGSKEGPDVVPLCQDFARMGYVVFSIQYRLGMESVPLFPNEQTASEAVVRGFHDYKAAIRYLRKSVAEEGNPFGINPDLIFGAGVSAGGFLSVHNLYMDEENEIPELVDQNKPGLGGGIEGESGNPGYSSHVIAGINIAGAIADTSMIDENEEPLISFHGDEDETVPFDIGDIVLIVANLGEVMGSNPIHAKLNELGIENCFEIQETAGHVPHVSNVNYYDTLLVKSRNFLARYTCGIDLTCEYENLITSNVSDIEAIKLMVYPNPASELITLEVPDGAWTVNVYDLKGQSIYSKSENTNRFLLNKLDIGTGMFLLRIKNKDYSLSRKLIFN